MNRTMRMWASSVLTVLLITALLAACVPVPTPMEPAAAGVNVEVVRALKVQNDASVGGALDVTGAATVGGALVMGGGVTIGDGGDTVAVNSSDWDISTTGAMTGIGAITADGLITGTAGATVSGATTSINASSNFGTNINTGTSSGALALGGGSGTVAIDSSDWDISTTGAMTGIGAITSDGAVATTSTLGVGTWLKIAAQAPVVVSAGSTITPTGTLQPLTSAGVVAGSTSEAIANGTTAGDLLILRNANASDAITIDGTGGNVECKADIVLGAEDTITLIWNGSNWICLSSYDNS